MILAIYGAGGLGRECLDLAGRIEAQERRWDEILYVVDEDYLHSGHEMVNSTRVLSFQTVVQKFSPENIEFIVAQGEPVYRKSMFHRVKNAGYHCATLVDPSATISASVILQEGVIVQPYSFLSCDVVVEENSLIASGCYIGHDCRIGAHSMISSNAQLAGGIRVGQNVYLGMSVCLRERISVGSDSIIGMGAVVLKDIPKNAVAYGNPARVVGNRDNRRVFSK